MPRRSPLLALALLIAFATPLLAQTKSGPADLASFHLDAVKISCKECHVEGNPTQVSPEAALASVNQQCVTCHGTAAKLGEQLAPKLKHAGINPHASHLVAIDCSTCHAGHDRPGKAYCLQCHDFDMPLPGLARAAKP